ncbi:MAG: cytosine permease, partial [Clostridiales Family XIII bacterium]|nr:cytosine permease [Clostridiales Family XIII bacterium]
MDDNKSKRGVMEKRALSHVPEDQRQSWISIAFIWMGIMICIPMLMVGGIFSTGYSVSTIVLVAAIGFGICAGVMFFSNNVSTDLGLPASMVPVKAFGDKGATYITSIVIFVAQTGWFGIQTATCAVAFNTLLGFADISIPYWVSCIIWGAVMLFTAVYGFTFMKFLNYIAVPALFAMCIYGVIYATKNVGWDFISSYQPPAETTMTVAGGISMTIGLFAGGLVVGGDFARYSKSRSQTALSVFVGVLPAAVFMMFAGAVMALSAGTSDVTLVFASMGVPAIGMLALILATWTTNTGNAYSAGMAVMKVLSLKDERRPLVTMICGGIGIIVAVAGLADALTAFVSLIGALMPTIAGVVVADYWIIGRGNPANWHPVRGFNFCGITAWVIGSAVALKFSFFSAALDGVIVAAAVYLILYGLLGKTKFGGQGDMAL